MPLILQNYLSSNPFPQFLGSKNTVGDILKYHDTR